MKWTERKWDFMAEKQDATASIRVLSATAEKLSKLSEGLNPEQLKMRVNSKWSVNEHAGHLLTMESLWIARLDDFVMGHEVLRPWNGTNADTEAAEFNRQRLGKIIADFREIRTSHLNLIESYLPEAGSMKAFHERLNQQMTLTDHLFFMAEHDLHHLATIENFIRS